LILAIRPRSDNVQTAPFYWFSLQPSHLWCTVCFSFCRTHWGYPLLTVRVPTPYKKGYENILLRSHWGFNVTWLFLGIYQWKSLLEMWISIPFKHMIHSHLIYFTWTPSLHISIQCTFINIMYIHIHMLFYACMYGMYTLYDIHVYNT
jgi:hypothetical protein